MSPLRKVSDCTLPDLNPGVGRPCNKLGTFFVYDTFIIPQKKSFGKKMLNFMHGFILAEWKNCQNGTFDPVHEIQNKRWPKDFF